MLVCGAWLGVAACATPQSATVHDAHSGFTLELPATWQPAVEAAMSAYRDPDHPEYTFWIAGGEIERTERNADLFGPGSKPAATLLDALLTGNPVAPQIHRREELGPDRALAFYRVTRFVAEDESQYSWTLVDKADDRLHVGVFTLSVTDAQADPARTETLLQRLWQSIATLRIDAAREASPGAEAPQG